MSNYKEFKANEKIDNFLYSYIDIPYTHYDKFVIVPDGCDYIVFSSKGYTKTYKKALHFQSIEVYEEALFILRLKPYTLSLLENKEYVFRSQLFTFSKDIFQSPSYLELISLLYESLFKDISIIDKKNFIVKPSIDMINESYGEIKVSELAFKLNTSIRTIQRAFKEFVGLSPKDYISIAKMQSDIRHTKKIEYIRSNHIPEHYTDYSHFYKNFKKIINVSPKIFYSSNINHINSIYDI